MCFHVRHALYVSMIILAGCASHDESSQEAAEFSRIIAAEDAKHPILPDETLIHNFQQHRSTFEELRQMIVADPSLHRVDDDWTDPADPATVGISPERIAEYRRLLTEVGCRRGFERGLATPGIYFISGTKGLAVAGQTKGYCYFETSPAPIVTNTATYSSPETYEEYEVYRPIEGHWYIYFDSY
jgi:hypothetical protein